MSTGKENKGPGEEKKSPFKDDAALETGSNIEQEETASSEEESEAEQMRKEALTERD
jgi:hypothetical protein